MDGHNYRDDMPWRLGSFLCSFSLVDATDLLGTSKLDLRFRTLVPSINCFHQTFGSMHVKSVWLHAHNEEYQANEN